MQAVLPIYGVGKVCAFVMLNSSKFNKTARIFSIFIPFRDNSHLEPATPTRFFVMQWLALLGHDQWLLATTISRA